jgi:hypothetical protein
MANTYNRVVINGGGGNTDAIDSFYDNSGSGLTATNVQAAIDELAASTGASYSASFIVGSWVLNVDKYNYTITAATHGRGASPILQVYQENGLNFDEVLTGFIFTGSKICR